MKNKMKGQQNIRRPLPIRIMALVMAVVMIFSVVYINNRKGVVKAAEKISQDSSYVSAIIGDTMPTNATMTVNVPYTTEGNYVEFDLPAYENEVIGDDEGEEKTQINIYTPSGGIRYFIDGSKGDAECNPGSLSSELYALKNTKYTWYIGESIDSLSAETTVSVNKKMFAVLKAEVFYTALSGEGLLYDVPVEDGPAPTTIATITFQPGAVGDFHLENGESISVVDTDFKNDGTPYHTVSPSSGSEEYYYGTETFDVTAGGTSVATGLTTLTALKEALKGCAEGTSITVTKNVKSGNKALVTPISHPITKNTTIIGTSFCATLKNGDTVVDTINGQVAENGKKSITSGTKINPAYDIIVSFTTDVEIPNAEPENAGDPGIEISGTDVGSLDNAGQSTTAHSFKLTTASVEDRDGVGYDTVVRIWDGEISEEFEIILTYDSGFPLITVDDITVCNKKPAETILYYVNKTDSSNGEVAISIPVTEDPTTSLATPAKATVTKGGKTQDIIGTTSPITGTLTGDLALTAGDNQLSITATNNYGFVSDPATAIIHVFYDPTAPTFTSIQLSQTISETSKSVIETITSSDESPIGTSVSMTQYISHNASAKIILDGNDETGGSGFAKIVSVTTATDPDTGTEKETETEVPGTGFVIPADPTSTATSATYNFRIYDEAGNVTPVAITVPFSNDVITITGPNIVNSGGSSYDVVAGKFLTWTGEAVKNKSLRKFSLAYTVTVSKRADLYSANLTFSNGSTNVPYDFDLSEPIDPVTNPEVTKTESGDNYIYTFLKEYDGSASCQLNDITFTATNIDNVSEDTGATVISIKVDSTDPEFGTPTLKDGTDDTASAATAVAVDGVDWYKRHLVLWFTSNDNGDPSSGLDTVKAISGADNTPVLDEGSFVVDVKQSADETIDDTTDPVTTAKQTTVELELTDKAGNVSTFKNVYHVDGTPPTTGLDITGVSASAYKETEPSLVNLNSAPSNIIISYSPDDTLSKILSGSTETTIKDSAGHERPIVTGKALSYYFTAEGSNPALDQGDTVEYTIAVKTSDNVGNIKIDSVRIKVDTTPPTSSLAISPDSKSIKNNGFYNGNVKLDATAVDTNIKDATITLTDTVDGGSSKTVSIDWNGTLDTGNGSGTATITGQGQHTVTLSITDPSGNPAGDKTVSFTIDTTAPSVTTLLNGSEYTKDNSYNKSVTTGVSYTDANKDDNAITATIVRDIPGGGQTTSTKKGLGPHSISEDGKYKVTYEVVDKAGNSTTTDPMVFTVDNTAPVHNLYVTTANPSKVEDYPNNYINGVGKWQSSHEAYRYGQFYNGDVTVEFNYFDYNLDWVYVTDNGEEISPSWTKNGAFGKATYTFTSEGYHDVQIWSKDLSGNETNDTVLGKRVRFTIDRSAPSITTYLNSSLYSEGSGTRYLNTNGSLNVSVSEGNKDTYDLTRSYKVTPPGGTSKTYEDKVDEGTENYSEEADYEVSYVAVDKAGNKSATRNVYFRVDRTAPKLTINGPGSSSNASSTSVSFNVQESFYWDMTSCTVKIYKKVDGSGEVLEKTLDMNPSSANYSQSYSFVDDAEYRMEFTAEDKCGNKSQTDYTFIKDGNAPSILLSGVKNYDKTDKNVELTITIEEAFYTSNRVTLSGTRTDIDGKSHKIDFDDFATNRTKISQLQQMFKEDGIYDITVTSTDKAGNSSSKTVHFTIDTTKPVIGDLSKYDGVKLNTFKWDVDLDELVKDLTVCDIKLYLDGALYDGTSDIEDGSHVLKVEATDELGHSSSKEVTFVLDSKAPNIIVMNVEEGDNLLESTDITVTVELDEDSLDTVTLNDKAINITNNEGKITVNEKGDYVLNATAHDEAGNVSSVEIKFSYGKQTNLLFIGIIAGAAILLLLLLLVFLRRRRENN